MISFDDVFLPKLRSLVNANLTNPSFSVDTICREMGVSRAQLHRIVTEQSDLSVTLYIRKIRLEKAYQLLTDTDLRVSEIADLVGINNPQNFSKYFTQEFAISPTEFRRLQQTPVPVEEPVLPETAAHLPPVAEVPPILATPEAVLPTPKKARLKPDHSCIVRAAGCCMAWCWPG